MCTCVIGEHIVAGWICHVDRTYNGLQRKGCKRCGSPRCVPLLPAMGGERFETYEEAYRDDPETLARVNEELEKARAEGR